MPARQIEFMESDELARLLAAPKGDAIEKRRDRAMLELLFSTGLRVSELVSLNRASVDFKKDEFSVRGKGDKIRVVFLSDAAKRSRSTWRSAPTWTGRSLPASGKRSQRRTPISASPRGRWNGS